MKLRLCFFMLALGICGAVVQGCDDNDDNLGLHSCGSPFIRTKQLSKGWIFRIHPFLFLYSIDK
jgi:hypothetical protein